jgi:hypothetical protein
VDTVTEVDKDKFTGWRKVDGEKLVAPANSLELEARREDVVFLTAPGLGVPARGSK